MFTIKARKTLRNYHAMIQPQHTSKWQSPCYDTMDLYIFMGTNLCGSAKINCFKNILIWCFELF